MNVVFIFKIDLDLSYQQPLASVSIANNALCQMDTNNGIRVLFLLLLSVLGKECGDGLYQLVYLESNKQRNCNVFRYLKCKSSAGL